MPPFLPRKRFADDLPTSTSSTPAKKAKLADVLDAPPSNARSLESNKEFTLGDDSSSSSSLSDVDSDQFEDVTNEHDAGDNDDEVDWEDALHEPVPEPTGDLQLTLSKNGEPEDYGSLAAAFGVKKGPTKRERQIRVETHRMHVQYLLFHNALRNMWISDEEVQQILLKQLPEGIMKEVERWKVASGQTQQPDEIKLTRHGRKGRKSNRDERDWGTPSQRIEGGQPDLSRGDPLIPLLRTLTAYWKKRFKITAPGLRKQGYKRRNVLKAEKASYQNDAHDPQRHGERIRSIHEFRARARQANGSRDVGAQLFTALLRTLGIESRLVANLQPIGFGWTKVEEATARNAGTTAKAALEDSSGDEHSDEAASKSKTRSKRKANANKTKEDSPTDSDFDEELSEASVVEITPSSKKAVRYDTDLPFPIYWTEVASPVNNTIIPVSPLVLSNPIANNADALVNFEPRGAKADKAKQVIAYVVAFSPDGTAKDVTTRYLKRHMWPGRTKGFRLPIEKVPIYNRRGKVKRYEQYDWFKETMRSYIKPDETRTAVDELEDSTDLAPQQPERKEAKQEADTLQSLRASAEFVLERFLRREEALKPGSQHVRTFTAGKGDKAKEENVYRRKDVVRCLSAESWHKEGRQVKAGEVPMKRVPVRAVTLTRKREVEEEERETGEKATQGLYSLEQTEYIIPPPIQNGLIPKNAYGNIDCFVPTMVPKGAVHIPLRGAARICKKLEIDYAEAVTGFEFGNKRAVPVIIGVIVAEENEHAVIDAWEAYAAEQRKKEEGKQEKAVLSLWRKMVMGLRIAERMQDEYGMEIDAPREVVDLTDDNPGQSLRSTLPASMDEEHGANFDHISPQPNEGLGGGGFLLHDEDEHQPEELVMDEGHPDAVGAAAEQYPTPVSAAHSRPKRTRKPLLVDSSESELSELSSSESTEADEDLKPSKKPNTVAKTNNQIERIDCVEISPGRRRDAVKDLKSKKTPRQSSRVAQTSPAKSTPRHQNPRKAKSNLKSPYFEDSDNSYGEDGDFV